MSSSAQPRFTAMAAAFYIATINNPSSKVCRRVGRAIERNAGLVRNERFAVPAQPKKEAP